jgi:hypothetical protein
MHAEYATAWLSDAAELPDAPPDPLDPADPADPPEAADPLDPLDPLEEAVEDAPDPRRATVGLLAAPPHPAASRVSAINPAISPIAFISSSPRAGWMLRAGLFYETTGYTTVSGTVTAL